MTGEKTSKTRKMRGNRTSLFNTHTSKMHAEAPWQKNPGTGSLFNSFMFRGLKNPVRQFPEEKNNANSS